LNDEFVINEMIKESRLHKGIPSDWSEWKMDANEGIERI
jgi:hypothetical protein